MDTIDQFVESPSTLRTKREVSIPVPEGTRFWKALCYNINGMGHVFRWRPQPAPTIVGVKNILLLCRCLHVISSTKDRPNVSHQNTGGHAQHVMMAAARGVCALSFAHRHRQHLLHSENAIMLFPPGWFQKKLVKICFFA